MQPRIYFVNDSHNEDYDPTTSFDVINQIKALASGFFHSNVDNPHRGIKVAKMAGSGDAKISIPDIYSWDDLVRNHVIPHFDSAISELTTESVHFQSKDPTGLTEKAYIFLIENLQRSRDDTLRKHEAFMNGAAEALKQIPAGLRR